MNTWICTHCKKERETVGTLFEGQRVCIGCFHELSGNQQREDYINAAKKWKPRYNIGDTVAFFGNRSLARSNFSEKIYLGFGFVCEIDEVKQTYGLAHGSMVWTTDDDLSMLLADFVYTKEFGVLRPGQQKNINWANEGGRP